MHLADKTMKNQQIADGDVCYLKVRPGSINENVRVTMVDIAYCNLVYIKSGL